MNFIYLVQHYGPACLVSVFVFGMLEAVGKVYRRKMPDPIDRCNVCLREACDQRIPAVDLPLPSARVEVK